MSEVMVEGGEGGESTPESPPPTVAAPAPPTDLTKKRLAFWGTLVLMLVVDQAVKAWARGAMVERSSLPGSPPFPGVFEFTLTYNEGIAFGLFQGKGALLAPVAVAIALGAAWYSLRHPKESFWSHFAMGLLASGAIGNLIDRIAHGRVTDMFWFRLIDFPVFNIADACITIATVLLMFAWLREANHKSESTPGV
jgi:signal peptidase II